ncbi:MAG: EutN/CcmL family microcompartment protein [Candidatus Erginobacter occultus]|nr:EutN/CcmL family microcompartment protein [Candidatus Erginobacter occultus]
MNLGRVIGTVISSRKVESLDGVKLLIVQPLDENLKDSGGPVVACDSQQAGPGQVVTFIGGREASLPLPNPFNPSDATVTSIVDEVSVGNSKQ